MKKFIPLLALLLTISACQPAPKQASDENNKQPSAHQQMKDMPAEQMVHLGCQEDEVDQDGKCVPAEQNNTSLFEQDLDQFVDSSDIETDGAMGFVAEPKNAGDYPGVVMMHEWWGLNDNVKYMAKLLAKEGYRVFAVDLYNGEVATDSDTAGKLAGAVRANPEGAIRTMKSAMRYLLETKKVPKIASLGWCFGGQQSLQLALNDKLDATVIYYGQLVNDKEQLKNISWPVLGIFGAADTGIPVQSVIGFQTALIQLGIENEVQIYPGVGHAFANPSGSNYAPEETIDAWERTIKFLDTSLKSENSKPAAMEYSCPKSESLNCMPTTDTPDPMCEKNYLEWIEENCEVEVTR